MKLKINKIIILVLLFALIRLSFGQEIKESKVGLYQYIAAAGGCVCAVGAGELMLIVAAMGGGIDMKDYPASKYVAVLGYSFFALAPAASAIGAYFNGNRYYAPNERGSFGWTLAGSYIGALPVTGLLVKEFWGGRNLSDSEVTLVIIGGILGAALSPLGAILGYQWSRPKNPQQGFLFNHLDPPSFCFKSEKINDGKTITTLDFRLINAKF